MTYYSYYQENNYAYGERVVRAILHACDTSGAFPLMGRIGPWENTRERLMARFPYRIIYRVEDETIIVLRILHTARQWPPGDQISSSPEE